jgi:hypothetical protein
MVNMAAMGSLMREYAGKLYEAGTGKPIEKEIMRDKILSLFKYWENNKDLDKLEMRFGTEEEKELIDILTNLFNLKDVGSLNDVRWKIRQWVKESSYPLWIFKLSEKSNYMANKAIESIFKLIQSIDKEITYDNIKSYLNSIKDVRFDLALIIKKEEAKLLFEKWLMKIENVKISETDIEKVIYYLKNNMQEEVASWKEGRVKEKVYAFLIEKERIERERIKKEKKEKESGGKEKENGRGSVSPPKEDKVFYIEEIKSKIEKCDCNKAKKILLSLIENKPEIVDYIEKYMRELP